jgi:haloalkane dehalogenase
MTDGRPEWLTQAIFPFDSRFVSIDGHRVHYIDEGPRDASVLLMLHGNPTWSFLCRHLVAALSDRFRCVALDLPGFGLSLAAEGYDLLPSSHAKVVERFVDVVGLRSFTPVVQDWGGPIGLWVAGRSADRVERLVVLNTWAWPVDRDPHFVWFSRAMGGAIGGFFIRHFNAFVNLLIPAGTPRRRLDPAAMDAYRRVLDTPARRHATNVFPREIIGSTPWLAEVEAGLTRLVDKPALIVWGDRDIAFRAIERERFERAFPRHETVLVPGAGHYMQEDAHEEIAAAIQRWW